MNHRGPLLKAVTGLAATAPHVNAFRTSCKLNLKTRKDVSDVASCTSPASVACAGIRE